MNITMAPPPKMTRTWAPGATVTGSGFWITHPEGCPPNIACTIANSATVAAVPFGVGPRRDGRAHGWQRPGGLR